MSPKHTQRRKRIDTKAEENRARQAHKLFKLSRYLSFQEAVHLIQDGNIDNMPMLTAIDMRRAFNMFRELVGSIPGKTAKKVSRAVYDDNLVMDEKKQVLNSDVIDIDGHRFLDAVCEPLQLTLQCAIERETTSMPGIALQGQLELLYSRGFTHILPQVLKM